MNIGWGVVASYTEAMAELRFSDGVKKSLNFWNGFGKFSSPLHYHIFVNVPFYNTIMG